MMADGQVAHSPPRRLIPPTPTLHLQVHVTDPGGTDLAAIFAQEYISLNVTGGTLWNTLSAYNPGLFSPDW